MTCIAPLHYGPNHGTRRKYFCHDFVIDFCYSGSDIFLWNTKSFVGLSTDRFCYVSKSLNSKVFEISSYRDKTATENLVFLLPQNSQRFLVFTIEIYIKNYVKMRYTTQFFINFGHLVDISSWQSMVYCFPYTTISLLLVLQVKL